MRMLRLTRRRSLHGVLLSWAVPGWRGCYIEATGVHFNSAGPMQTAAAAAAAAIPRLPRREGGPLKRTDAAAVIEGGLMRTDGGTVAVVA